MTIRFKNSPLGITANKLNKAFLASGGGAGTGDMTKAVYDVDGNGIVDTADSIPWSRVTGKPATTGDMTKAVYDVNNDGISDHAALADAAPWTGITGKPATFPPDSTAMLKATYDTNADGVTDHAALADAVPWTGVSGKPATFPPDATAMLKSVYDINGDGISDRAATADSVPWTGVTGKPATFPPDVTAELVARKGVVNGYAGLDGAGKVPTAQLPSTMTPTAHHTTHEHGGSDLVSVTYADLLAVPATFVPSAHAVNHKSGGSDAIALDTLAATTDITTLNASTTAHGLLPKLAGGTSNFLRSDGTWAAPAGAGDMTKAVYDTNADNIVDQAAAVPWVGITGKPTGNLVDPGTWTTLTPGSGWTVPTQAQYRVEVNGAVSTVYFRGMISAAYSALGITAFTAPVGARPSMTRSAVLGGAQNTGTPSDIASYLASVSSAGVCTIYFLCAAAFVWADPAQTQQVYLDGLFYSL